MKSLRLPLAVSVTIFVGALFAQSSNLTMKAVVVHEYGGPEVLKYEEVPRPEPKEDKILVRVKEEGVNHEDNENVSGEFGSKEEEIYIVCPRCEHTKCDICSSN